MATKHGTMVCPLCKKEGTVHEEAGRWLVNHAEPSDCPIAYACAFDHDPRAPTSSRNAIKAAEERSDVLIDRESAQQDEQWGGPEHDDQHDPSDWLRMIEKFVGKAWDARANMDQPAFQHRLVQVAALARAGLRAELRRENPNGEPHKCPTCGGCRVHESCCFRTCDCPEVPGPL